MEFPTVYKIDKKKIVESGRDLFVREDDTPKLFQPEEYKLLYFLRESRFVMFSDCPCLGATTTVLTNSHLKGPFDSKPGIKEPRNGMLGNSFREEKIIERIMSTVDVPSSFKDVDYRVFGLRTNEPIFPHLVSSRLEKDQPKRIMEICKASLANLEGIAEDLSVKRYDKGGYSANGCANGCVFNLYFSPGSFYDLPDLTLKAFGTRYKPDEIIVKAGLDELRTILAVLPYEVDFGLVDCTQEGLAYNLSVGKGFHLGKVPANPLEQKYDYGEVSKNSHQNIIL
jgi:hypothetical protein